MSCRDLQLLGGAWQRTVGVSGVTRRGRGCWNCPRVSCRPIVTRWNSDVLSIGIDGFQEFPESGEKCHRLLSRPTHVLLTVLPVSIAQSPWLLTLEYIVLTPPMCCVSFCFDGKPSLANEVSGHGHLYHMKQWEGPRLQCDTGKDTGTSQPHD